MKIQILDKEVELKSSFRAYIIFENITGKSFQSVQTLSDVLVFMYATILASLKTTDISFDTFMDYIDSNPNVVTEFSEWLTGVHEVVNEASNTVVEEESAKKKIRKTKKS
jgi:hypothetical protein